MNKTSFFDPWLWKMAWRDSRSNRGRLLLFVSSIIVGIAALVAINSFGRNLEETIRSESRSIVGADLVLSSRSPFPEELESRIAEWPAEEAREITFASMAYFPRVDGTRLITVRALEGNYPFYGTLETTPVNAADDFRRDGSALVDYSVILQYELELGDTVKLGNQVFPIAGYIQKVPGQAEAASMVAPRIYIPMDQLENTGLIRFGSRVNYRKLFKFDNSGSTASLLEGIESLNRKHRIRSRTAEQQGAGVGSAAGNMYGFLNLVAFIALLLGSIGVASAIHVYIKMKLPSLAVLRCVGARIRQTFYIYLIQTLVIGTIGSLIGVILGVGIQVLLPDLFASLLPVQVDFAISWRSAIEGLVVGLGICMLFALLPLLTVRKVSPLSAIRTNIESQTDGRDPLRLLLYAVIAIAATLFAISQTARVDVGLSFIAGVAIAFAALSALALLLMWGVKRFFPSGWRYEWRQSLANLYRPNNQTLVLMLSIGLGTFLISTLYFTQDTLLSQVATLDRDKQPNLMMFDIQADQVEGVEELVRSFDLPVIQNVPIVTTRLAAIKGRTVEEIDADSTSEIKGWALKREYRVTYRDTLFSTEEVVEGDWVGTQPADSDTIFVSLETGIVRDLNVQLGDQLTFDVQGVKMPAIIKSIRKVDWQRVQPNFFAVFPRGVIDDAPQFNVLVTRVADQAQSSKLQQAMVKAFPNVSSVDLDLILKTVEKIIDQISFVIRFMALFSILTGLIVLSAAVITTRYQRIRESVLLRTLGAVKQQVNRIMMLEYFYLGALAGLTGMLLSLLSSWALAYFMFDLTFVPSVQPLAIILALVVMMTVGLGMLNSRKIADRPPLEILRNEV